MPKKPPPRNYPAEHRRRLVEPVRYEGKRNDGLTSAEHEELSRLRRENRVLREEKEILRKGRGLVPRGVDEDPAEAFGFVKANQASCSVRRLCRMLDVSPWPGA